VVGVLTAEITADDGAGLTDVATLTVTVTGVVVADQVVLSQGYGGTTINKLVKAADFSSVVNFAGLPGVVARLLGDPGNRAANTAVADLDGYGVKDIVVGFGVSGQGSLVPSLVVVWSPTGGGEDGSLPKSITSKGVFSPDAANEALRNPYGAVNVAVGNVLGEGPMIIAAQGQGGSNQIRVLKLVQKNGKWALDIVGQFQGLTGYAVQTNAAGGTAVACGDVDGDGLDEVVVGQMSSNEAYSTLFQIVDLHRDTDGRVKVLRVTKPVPAVQRVFRGLGGVNLAVGDLDGDGKKNEIVAAVSADPAGANNPRLKNFLRVFEVTADDKNRIASIKAVTPLIGGLGADVNPSGGLSVAVGNLDADKADEVLVGTQAVVSLDPDSGDVSVTAPAPAAVVKGINVDFAADGTFTGSSAATPRVTAFGGVNKPSSGAVNVQFYPGN
jgi:hypothetical protein